MLGQFCEAPVEAIINLRAMHIVAAASGLAPVMRAAFTTAKGCRPLRIAQNTLQ
jgi:hypothetical protein